jgi:hypothetical protein
MGTDSSWFPGMAGPASLTQQFFFSHYAINLHLGFNVLMFLG